MTQDLKKNTGRGWGRKLTLVFLGVAMLAGIGRGLVNRAADPLPPQPVAVTETITPPPPPVIEAIPQQYVSAVAGIPAQSRALTAGEAALAQKIFGARGFDASQIRLHFFASGPEYTQALVPAKDGKNIEIFGADNASADYSQEKDALNYALFVRQMTGLWQNQQDYLRAGKSGDTKYVLKEELDFINYGPAQQREMVTDYMTRIFHDSHQTQTLRLSLKGGDNLDSDNLLRATVENQFFTLKEARLALRETYARPITQGEAANFSAFFGAEMKPWQVKHYMYPYEAGKTLASVESGYGANFWGPQQHAPDYSLIGQVTPEQYGTWWHEMTHVWQNQTNGRHTPNQMHGQYRYWLNQKSAFHEFSVEQQAALVEDYVMYFMHPSKATNYLQQSYNKDQIPQMAQLLKKIVEAQFPGAKTMREAYEMKQGQQAPIAIKAPQRALTPAMGIT